MLYTKLPMCTKSLKLVEKISVCNFFSGQDENMSKEQVWRELGYARSTIGHGTDINIPSTVSVRLATKI